jgi:hypothetical protein
MIMLTTSQRSYALIYIPEATRARARAKREERIWIDLIDEDTLQNSRNSLILLYFFQSSSFNALSFLSTHNECLYKGNWLSRYPFPYVLHTFSSDDRMKDGLYAFCCIKSSGHKLCTPWRGNIAQNYPHNMGWFVYICGYMWSMRTAWNERFLLHFTWIFIVQPTSLNRKSKRKKKENKSKLYKRGSLLVFTTVHLTENKLDRCVLNW